MKNYIVRIENNEEWKSVQLKAREIGVDWYQEPNPEMMLELYSDEGLDTEEDVFLFVHGDKNLCFEETNPMTLEWGLMIPTDDWDGRDFSFDSYEEISAKDFLEKYKEVNHGN